MGDVLAMQVHVRFPGRVWQWNEDEDAALEYLPWADQVLYLRGLRRFMDFETGIVGERRRINYQGLGELLEVHRERGSTRPSERPRLEQIRASLARLARAGLVERVEDSGLRPGASLVFKLPLAHVGLIRANEEPHRNPNARTTGLSPELARVGGGVNHRQENGMNPIHQYVCNKNKSPNGDSENSSEFSAISAGVVVAEPGKPADQLGDCPHAEILGLWAQVFPGLPQPNPSLWGRSQSASALRARWREMSQVRHSQTRLPLYVDRSAGLVWWRAFFEYLRDRCGVFLLRSDSRFFDLHWLVKRSNFLKALDKKYEDRT